MIIVRNVTDMVKRTGNWQYTLSNVKVLLFYDGLRIAKMSARQNIKTKAPMKTNKQRKKTPKAMNTISWSINIKTMSHDPGPQIF